MYVWRHHMHMCFVSCVSRGDENEGHEKWDQRFSESQQSGEWWWNVLTSAVRQIKTKCFFMLLLENYRDDVLFISSSSAKVHWHLEKGNIPLTTWKKEQETLRPLKRFSNVFKLVEILERLNGINMISSKLSCVDFPGWGSEMGRGEHPVIDGRRVSRHVVADCHVSELIINQYFENVMLKLFFSSLQRPAAPAGLWWGESFRSPRFITKVLCNRYRQ